MSDTTTVAKAEAALRLADKLRASVRRRAIDLDFALIHFDDVTVDPAASDSDEIKAAAVLMEAIRRTDEAHRLRMADAWGEFAAVTNGRGEVR